MNLKLYDIDNKKKIFLYSDATISLKMLNLSGFKSLPKYSICNYIILCIECLRVTELISAE